MRGLRSCPKMFNVFNAGAWVVFSKLDKSEGNRRRNETHLLYGQAVTTVFGFLNMKPQLVVS
jgi:hypothetical protein